VKSQTVHEAQSYTALQLQTDIAVTRLTSLLGSPTSVVSASIHNAILPDIGSSACLIKLASNKSVAAHKDFLEDLASRLSKHASATRPRFISKSQISPSEVAEKTAEIRQQLADQLKKRSDKFAASMLTKKLDKFYEQTALEEQSFEISSEGSQVKIKELLGMVSEHVQADLRVEELIVYHASV
jgi:translation elongation factor EF-Ts